jgi:hypothetical protein
METDFLMLQQDGVIVKNYSIIIVWQKLFLVIL